MKKIEELNAPYDIAVPPLYRFYLFKTGAKEYVFHMNAHHIIADGVSVISIIEELWKLYKNRRAKKFRLEEEDFLDYALWQEQNPDYKDKAQFFLDMFKDGVPENEMPLARPAPRDIAACGTGQRGIFISDRTRGRGGQNAGRFPLFAADGLVRRRPGQIRRQRRFCTGRNYERTQPSAKAKIFSACSSTPCPYALNRKGR